MKLVLVNAEYSQMAKLAISYPMRVHKGSSPSAMPAAQVKTRVLGWDFAEAETLLSFFEELPVQNNFLAQQISFHFHVPRELKFLIKNSQLVIFYF